MWQQIKEPGWPRQGASFLVGCAFAMLQYLLSRWMQPTGGAVLDARRLPTPSAPSMIWVQHFWATLDSLPWIGLLFVALVALAALERGKKHGWLSALVAGIAFPGVIIQFLAI